MAGQKIRIRLKAYDHEVIDTSARKIVETVTRTGAQVAGPVPLPTEKNVYCVIRSPHKYKDSREQFEVRTHKRLIDVMDPGPKTIENLTKLDLPAGVAERLHEPDKVDCGCSCNVLCGQPFPDQISASVAADDAHRLPARNAQVHAPERLLRRGLAPALVDLPQSPDLDRVLSHGPPLVASGGMRIMPRT